MPDSTCALCGSSADDVRRAAVLVGVTCERCGEYELSILLQKALEAQPIENKGSVSGWIRRQNVMGITPVIGDIDSLNHLRILTKPPFRERVEQYLLAAGAKSPRLDQPFAPVTADLIATSYSDDANELAVILQYLQDQELMTELRGEGKRRLTAQGYITADDLRTRRAKSTQAFVAMSFDESLRSMYEEGLEPGIRHAAFTPMLISNKEHANKIDDEIIAEIRRSAFLVADFTEHRQNVYFETGFAIGLGLQVVWTCRKDHIKDLHFDIRQYNSIDWESSAELAQYRIEAMFGRGPHVTS